MRPATLRLIILTWVSTIALFVSVFGTEDSETQRPVFSKDLNHALDRHRFSGRPLLLVVASNDRVVTTLRDERLNAPELRSACARFIPVIVTEGQLRAHKNLGFVVPKISSPSYFVFDVSGRLLRSRGGSDVTAAGLARLLNSTKCTVRKSPLYRMLRESAEPITRLIERGKRERAERIVEILAAVESDAQVVDRARAALN